ncbi:MAG: type IV pilin protein [Pseudomonadales bacterium]
MGKKTGFTLIELLIALAILAIVSAIAVPLYTTYSQRTYRNEAQGDLLNCAQGLERFASINFTYRGSADTDADGLGDADNGPIAAEICGTQSQLRYAITVAATAAGFVLTADPQAGPMVTNGFITLDDGGNRAWDQDDNNAIGAGEDDWVY